MDSIDYIALLRGINVGGKNTIKMDELKKIFENMGFTDIDTYIQSGNVLFKDYEKDKQKLAKRIEKTLFDKTKNDIMVTILKLAEINDILDGIPDGFGEDNSKYKYDILFLIGSLTTNEIMKEIKTIEGNDKIYEGKKVFYVRRIAEKLTGSYISQIVNKWQNITVRNLKTTRKIYELMLERNNIKY